MGHVSVCVLFVCMRACLGHYNYFSHYAYAFCFQYYLVVEHLLSYEIIVENIIVYTTM